MAMNRFQKLLTSKSAADAPRAPHEEFKAFIVQDAELEQPSSDLENDDE